MSVDRLGAPGLTIEKKDYEKELNIAAVRTGYFAALDQQHGVEAALLLEHERYPGAYHQLVTALEELGKTRSIAGG